MIGRPPRQEAREALEKRFWSKAEKTDGCWIWKATKCKGYGSFGRRNPHRKVRANRVAWELTYGEIPDGMHVLHACDNPPCVRPDHLFLGTNLDNIKDRIAKGRGQKLTPEQVRVIRNSEGKTHVQLAKEFGVTFGMIGHIKRRKAYTHVDQGKLIDVESALNE